MTKQEFETRAKIEVTDQEYFQVIEPMYMSSDVEKDEFCKLWGKMNHKRVKAYLEDQLKRRKEAERKDRLFNLKWMIENLGMEKQGRLAINVLTENQQKDLEAVGIALTYKNPMFGFTQWYRLTDIHYELLKFFGQIKAKY